MNHILQNRLPALIVLLACAASPLHATLFSNTGGGNWNDTATWTQAGYPQAGDGVDLRTAGTIVVTQNEEFGGVGVDNSFWLRKRPDLQINDGMTLTHLAGGTFNIDASTNRLSGGGTSGWFLNQGTIKQTYFYRSLQLLDGITFENQGTYRFDAVHSNIRIGTNSTFFNNGGTIDVQASSCRISGLAVGDVGTFTTWDGTEHKPLTINVAASAQFWVGEGHQNGTHYATGLNGDVHISSLDVASNGVFRISGGSSPNFSGDFTANGAFHVRNKGVFNPAEDITLNFAQGMTWEDATIDLRGHTLTIVSDITQSGNSVSVGLTDSVGGGTLRNEGTYTHNATWRGIRIEKNATFENAGVFQSLIQTDSAGTIGVVDAASVFRNLPGGVVEFKSGHTGASSDAVMGSGTFDNQGTFISSLGTVSSIQNTKLTQYSGSPNTLTGGTWISTGGSALNLKYAGRGNIDTIGSGATVVLEDGGTIDAITAALTTVNGTFRVNGTSTFTDASGFTVGDGGTAGGTGTIAANVTIASGGRIGPGSGSGLVGTLDVTGDVTIEDGGGFTLDYDSASETIDSLTVSGTLTLPAAATVNLNIIGSGGPGFGTKVVATAGTLDASAGVGNWTVTASDGRQYKPVVQGNELSLEFTPTGTTIMIF